jgi:hypothetical protein
MALLLFYCCLLLVLLSLHNVLAQTPGRDEDLMSFVTVS